MFPFFLLSLYYFCSYFIMLLFLQFLFMCKTNNYKSEQKGIFNVWLSTQSLPWILVGILMVCALWGLLSCHTWCKKRKRRQGLQDHNLHLQNAKLGSSTPFFAASLAQMPPPLPYTQPFIPTPAPLVGAAPPYDHNYHPLTLALNKPII